jgi:hypothetical protein
MRFKAAPEFELTTPTVGKCRACYLVVSKQFGKSAVVFSPLGRLNHHSLMAGMVNTI